jgi:hypothetical protein
MMSRAEMYFVMFAMAFPFLMVLIVAIDRLRPIVRRLRGKSIVAVAALVLISIASASAQNQSQRRAQRAVVSAATAAQAHRFQNAPWVAPKEEAKR